LNDEVFLGAAWGGELRQKPKRLALAFAHGLLDGGRPFARQRGVGLLLRQHHLTSAHLALALLELGLL
jgi:hypothetical protein